MRVGQRSGCRKRQGTPASQWLVVCQAGGSWASGRLARRELGLPATEVCARAACDATVPLRVRGE